MAKKAKINVKYFDKNIAKLEYGGDWIDLRVSAVSTRVDRSKPIERLGVASSRMVKEGEEIKVWFGVAMELPENHEAIVLPRGSLFKNTRLIFVSSGVIDEGYKGDGDEWFATFKSTRKTIIYQNERICQFRIQEKQPEIEFEEVDELKNPNRGGHGSTGRF